MSENRYNTKGKGLSILCVDDDSTVLRLVSSCLAETGHIVDLASTPEVAIRKLKQNNYDLVITDVMMPDINGYELVSRMHRGEFGEKVKNLPYLFLTALGEKKIVK